MRATVICALLIGVSLSASSCSPSEFAREDLGLAVSIGISVDRIGSLTHRTLPDLPPGSFNAVGGTAGLSSEDDGFVITYTDLDRDGKVDLILFSSLLYARSEFAPGSESFSEKLRTTFTREGFARFVDGFTAKYPQIKTKRGLTLGATRQEVLDSYGLVPQVSKREAMKEVLGYRQGGIYLLFVILAGRVVRIAVLRRLYDMDYHLKKIG